MAGHDDPVVSDESLPTFNADEKVDLMLDYINHMKKHYKGNHLMVPMGNDFTYGNAILNFRSMDRLIKYFNNKVDNIKLVYSTPSEYLDSLIE